MAATNLLVIVDELSLKTFQEHAPRFGGVNIAVGLVTETEELKKQAAWAHIVLLLSWKPAKEILELILQANPEIKWVHTWWAGVDSLIFPELKNYRLMLTNGRGSFAQALAEYAIAVCLYFAKDFPRFLRSQKAACWDPFEGELIAGKTLGIFGYGEIGRSVAQKAKCLGMSVIAVRRRAAGGADEYADRIMPSSSILELCAGSDFIVASAPLTPETRGMFNRAAFAAMKPSAVFVNIGRGPVVVEAHLISALSSRIIRAAALDVFEDEPLPASSPLWTMDNVVLSPHCADRYDGWLARTLDFYLENLLRFLAGQPLKNIVDPEQGY